VNLRQGRVLRIGHRGAAALAPENTLASIEAAIEYELDLVEIDVVAHANALRLAHSPAAVRDESPTLDDALTLVAGADAGVVLDLKSRGIERSAVDTLREHNLLDRAVIASFHPASLRTVKEVEPALTTGVSSQASAGRFRRAARECWPARRPTLSSFTTRSSPGRSSTAATVGTRLFSPGPSRMMRLWLACSRQEWTG
jgi:glycerophosphoryl diester phosphodiesterase